MARFPRLRWSIPLKHKLQVVALVVLGIGFLGASIILLMVALTPVPDISTFANRQVDQSTKIYDRTGQVLLYDYNRDAKRVVVPLADISPAMQSAAIAIEDSSFYEHGGIRIASIVRAALADLIPGGATQGGSTITQQVVKNTLLTNQRTLTRKVHEWILAIKLEQKYSKTDILGTYLNTIPLGGTLYGVEAASEAYFGIPAKDLDLAHAAYLAAMIQAPSYFSPYGPNKAALDTRKNVVLDRMHTLGFIDDASYAAAKTEAVSFSPTARVSSIIAPHFVFYILNQLSQQFGENALVSGLHVTTTLDADLEAHAEGVIAAAAPGILADDKASNEAMIAVDPATGQILAMVGSNNFFSTTTDGQYNATLALRQPGSTMKPFIYSLALERGYTRDTVVFDTPTQFSTSCKPSDLGNSTPPCYAPVNYDNTFRGPMTLETALAQSINVPAIKVLYLVGIQNAINLAESMGLTSLGDANQYGLTLVLGGGEVRLLDLTGAYAAFANGGVKNAPTGILEVDDASGNVLEKYAPNPARVLPENIANDMDAMLSDNPARVPEYSLNSPLYFPGYDVAVKTGTTDDTRDAWVVGYTPSIAIGTWAGNNDNTPMVKSIAGMILAPSWHDIMAYALTKYPKTYFGEPDPIPANVPPMLEGNWRIPDKTGAVVPHSLLYWTDKNDPRGAAPADPSQDPQFAYWEYGVSTWYASHPNLFSGGIMLPVPLAPAATTTSSTTPVSGY
jgi:penicillin-binding protein 1C